MSLFSSSQFASAAAQGEDWRSAAKAVLEKLQDAQNSGATFNFGFLYVSDLLSEDAESILNLFKSVLEIEHWVGGVTLGVCANGESFIDKPAISAMIAQFDDADFKIFPPINLDPDAAEHTLKHWQNQNEAMLVCVHGDPMTEEDPALILKNLENLCPGFMVGGLTSSRQTHAQFADEFYQGGVCGAVFSSRVAVASTLSQGCDIIGDVHTITNSDDHEVLELDGAPAVNAFEKDLRSMVIKKADFDPDTVMIEDAGPGEVPEIPAEFQNLIQGEVHAAIAVSESDGKDYLVRNIIGMNPDDGSMLLAQHVMNGERIMFVHRTHETVERDLSASLLNLRKRIQKEHGEFAPKGALYVSCVARAFNEFEGAQKNEMALIHEIIGDVPLTGFYASGEINKGRLYGYTGILTLFL